MDVFIYAYTCIGSPADTAQNKVSRTTDDTGSYQQHVYTDLANGIRSTRLPRADATNCGLRRTTYATFGIERPTFGQFL